MTEAIVALGSSSFEPSSPLPRELEARLGVPVDARGVRGSRVAQWLTWALEGSHGTSEVLGHAVLVLLGGNDLAPSSEHIAAIDHALRRRGARAVVWVPPPQYVASSPAHGRDERMRAALEAARVVWVRRPVRIPSAEYARDLVHPTRRGYERWATIIAPEIRTALRSPEHSGPPVLPLLALAALALLVLLEF